MPPSPPHVVFAPDPDLYAPALSIQRRRALAWLAGAGVAGLTGCGGGASATGVSTASTLTTTTSTATAASTSASTCAAVAEETAGPYPADGSNSASVSGATVDALMLSGIVRSDIRSSIAGATGIARGVPLTVELQLVDSNAACASLAGYAVYLWHCDRDGNYSLYSSGVTNENYLRGVQTTDAGGKVSFTTIFPACYAGRMPHIHLEIYRSETTATSYTNKLRTSQIALPPDVCSTVYGTATGYSASVANLARISFATDNVFSDGVTTELATVSGSVAAGYLASLVVGIPL
jgi:protocatechuate 3,4-dioxygenase beta subunit